MKKIFLLLVLIFASSQLLSQIKFKDHLFGPELGFGTKGSAIIYGLNYEYELPQAGIGTFGVGALGRYWTYSDKIDSYTFDVTNLTLGGQVNYNFNQIGNGKFAPFVGVFIGYNNVSTKYTAAPPESIIAIDKQYKSAFQIWAQCGLRYFFTPKVAGVVRLGLGNLDFSVIELGADFKF